MKRHSTTSYGRIIRTLLSHLALWAMRGGAVCIVASALWFALMVFLPDMFPFNKAPGAVFVIGIVLFGLGAESDGDDVWPMHGSDSDWPIDGSASHVDIFEFDDD